MSERNKELTYDLGLLDEHRAIWDRSPGLRFVYGRLFAAIDERRVEGATLEIGSGIGSSADFLDGVVTSDIVGTPYAAREMSGYAIKFAESGPWGNIIAVDVLHHLTHPLRFLESAAQALRPGGRIILAEPAATLVGRLFYGLFHHEPIQVNAVRPPFDFEPDDAEGRFANMGIASAIFERHRNFTGRFLAERGLRCVELNYRELFTYPLTGGFSRVTSIRPAVLRRVACLEAVLPQWLFRIFGLRMVIVLQKKKAPAA